MPVTDSTWDYREGKVYAPCSTCGADIQAAGEYIVRTHRFSVSGTPHAPAFYAHCVPCGLSLHWWDDVTKQVRAALRERLAAHGFPVGRWTA